MKIGNILWGIVLITLGIILGINALEITYINIFFTGWWTLFIIIPCFIDLFDDKDKTGSLIGLVIGILLLLGSNNIINFEIVWKLLFPAILIVLGLSCLFKNQSLKEVGPVKGREFHSILSGQNLDFSNEIFEGCKLNSVFGDIQCDLRNASIKDKSVIVSNAIFSKITIFVPENINIKVVSTPILGSISNKVKKREEKNKTIYIKAVCIFGSIEVKK